MTTVAYDGRTMACDGLGVDPWDKITCRSINKITLHSGTYIGSCGEKSLIQRGVRYLTGKDKKKPVFKDDEGFTLLIVRGGLAQLCGPSMEPFSVDVPIAIGSGAEIALGAMYSGKTAKQAVKIASTVDVFTGGRIRSRTVK